MELRSRVIAFVEEGRGHREAARHFRVSPKFVNDMVILKRESGGLVPREQGNHAEGKLARYAGWVRDRLAVKGDLTLDEISAELHATHGVSVHRASVGKWLHRLGISHKKNAARQRAAAARRGRGATALGGSPPAGHGQPAGDAGLY
jgi:transposase